MSTYIKQVAWQTFCRCLYRHTATPKFALPRWSPQVAAVSLCRRVECGCVPEGEANKGFNPRHSAPLSALHTPTKCSCRRESAAPGCSRKELLAQKQNLEMGWQAAWSGCSAASGCVWEPGKPTGKPEPAYMECEGRASSYIYIDLKGVSSQSAWYG